MSIFETFTAIAGILCNVCTYLVSRLVFIINNAGIVCLFVCCIVYPSHLSNNAGIVCLFVCCLYCVSISSVQQQCWHCLLFVHFSLPILSTHIYFIGGRN